mgnify:CR=1 FL=1
MKTLIISPTYNEKKNIQQLVDLVLRENPEFHLLIVDDNSPDGTSFSAGYLRQWRFKDNDEWGIAVEVLRPL